MDGEWSTPVGRNGKPAKVRAAPVIATKDLSEVKKAFQLQAFELAKRVQAGSRGQMRGTGNNFEKTQCGMIYRDGGKDLAVVTGFSGYEHSLQETIKNNRRNAGVAGKEKICAEENLLAANPNLEFLFSFAFDQMGLKPACPDCKKILDTLGIEDLMS